MVPPVHYTDASIKLIQYYLNSKVREAGYLVHSQIYSQILRFFTKPTPTFEAKVSVFVAAMAKTTCVYGYKV